MDMTPASNLGGPHERKALRVHISARAGLAPALRRPPLLTLLWEMLSQSSSVRAGIWVPRCPVGRGLPLVLLLNSSHSPTK